MLSFLSHISQINDDQPHDESTETKQFDTNSHKTLNNEKPLISYMIITRDKARTYPIITQIPQLANSSRDLFTSRYRNALIHDLKHEFNVTTTSDNTYDVLKSLLQGNVCIKVNKENEVRKLIHNIASKVLNVSSEILHYQMLFQSYRKDPEILESRTVILTYNVLFLCQEDLASPNINLQIIDYVYMKDIVKLLLEEDSSIFTVIMKSNSTSSNVSGNGDNEKSVTPRNRFSMLLSLTKKWRLKCDDKNKALMIRLHDECKRVCQERGNIDV